MRSRSRRVAKIEAAGGTVSVLEVPAAVLPALGVGEDGEPRPPRSATDGRGPRPQADPRRAAPRPNRDDAGAARTPPRRRPRPPKPKSRRPRRLPPRRRRPSPPPTPRRRPKAKAGHPGRGRRLLRGHRAVDDDPADAAQRLTRVRIAAERLPRAGHPAPDPLRPRRSSSSSGSWPTCRCRASTRTQLDDVLPGQRRSSAAGPVLRRRAARRSRSWRWA